MTEKSSILSEGAPVSQQVQADARPRRRRKEARPAEILAAGMLEFAEKGFADARLEDVARRAGIAKGTIYRYFPDKQALFLAAMRARVGPTIEDVARLVDSFPGHTRDMLGVILRQLYAQLVNTDLHTLMRIIIAEGWKFPELVESYYRENIAVGKAMLTRIVARGIARGEFRDGPVAQEPMIVIAPAIMATVWRLTFEKHDPLNTERFIAAHLDLVLNGLGAAGR